MEEFPLGPGRGSSAIGARLPITFGGYFALRVPFTIAAAAADLPGNVNLNVDLCGPNAKTQCDSVAWVLANNVVPPFGTTPISGTFFAQNADGSPGFALEPTSVSAGQVAIVYSGGLIRNFIDDGSGWRHFGADFSPPTDWIPLQFEIDADADVLVPTQVPEPGLLLIFGVVAALLRRPATSRS